MDNIIDVYANAIVPLKGDHKYELSGYKKYSYDDFLNIAVGVAPIIDFVRKASVDAGLYRVTIPKGTHLAFRKDGTGYIGGLLDDGTNKVSGQATLNKDNGEILKFTDLAMAAAIININLKLSDIQMTQKEIKDYLHAKDEAKLLGNVEYMQKVLEDYRYHKSGSNLELSTANQIEEIKREALATTNQFSTVIRKRIAQFQVIHFDTQFQKEKAEIQDYLRSLRTANYMYAFASFLSVLLEGNTNEEYLNKIIQEIESNALKYRELYTEAYNCIEEYAKTSLQSLLIKGTKKASVAMGKAIAKTPVISKGPIDEALIETGKKLEHAEKLRQLESMELFNNESDSGLRSFSDLLRHYNRSFNEPQELIFDNQYVYLPERNLR